MTLLRVLCISLFLAGLTAVPLLDATAASTGNRSSSASTAPGADNSFAYGSRAVEEGDWRLAVKYLEKAVRLNPRDADAFNLLAYSYRRLGKLDPAFENYNKALALDGNHRGAHEYIGQAYLMVGELDKAETHLSKLSDICGNGCAETRKLAKAIERFKENEKSARLDADW